MLRYTVETLAAWDEAAQLWQGYWDEVRPQDEEMPLDPDISVYEELEREGNLLFLGVRTSDDELVGFYVTFIMPHYHHKSVLCAFADVWYLAPMYRKGAIGFRLLRMAEAECRKRGVQRMYGSVMLDSDIGTLLEAAGWQAIEKQYSKNLEAVPCRSSVELSAL